MLQWILQNILKIQTFQRTAKLIIANFYKMDFMKGIVILLKVDKMYNILKSLLATVISRDMKVKLDDQSF